MKYVQFFFFVLVTVLASTSIVNAQWTSNSGSQQVYLNATTDAYSVGVGAGANNSQSILAKFHVANEALFSTSSMTTGPSLGAGNLSIAGSNGGLSIWKGSLTSINDTTTVGNRWLWYNPDGGLRVRTGSRGDVLALTTGGNIGIGSISNLTARLTVEANSPTLRIRDSISQATAQGTLGTLDFTDAYQTTGAEARISALRDSTSGSSSHNPSALTFSTMNGGTTLNEVMRMDYKGNMGIGTTSPQNKLDVNGGIYAHGSVGVGVASPAAPIDILNSSGGGTLIKAKGSTSTSVVTLQLLSTAASGEVDQDLVGSSGSGSHSTIATAGDYALTNYYNGVIFSARNNSGSFHFATGFATDTERVTISHLGNLGLGTTTPGNKLNVVGGVVIGNTYGSDTSKHPQTGGMLVEGSVGIASTVTTSDSCMLKVNGRIKAKEVVVDTTGWADFVFDQNYPLASLNEVEKVINQEKHLPGVPTADEVGKNGVNVGQIQSKLLQKIEELTLYVIDQNKRLTKLTSENEQLKKRVAAVEEK